MGGPARRTWPANNGGGRPRAQPDRVLADEANICRANRASRRRRKIKVTNDQPRDQAGHRTAQGSRGRWPAVIDGQVSEQSHAVECGINIWLRHIRNTGYSRSARRAT
nr:hypothetical protein GCM10020241_48920 [Streptoalloteichus tenebrarius]